MTFDNDVLRERKETLLKKTMLALVGISLAALLYNYVSIIRPVAQVVDADPRNAKIGLWAYHRYGVVPTELTLDLRRLDASGAPIDVMRVLFDSARGLKDKRFNKVYLAYQGTEKFLLEGAYFESLGKNRRTENVAYTLSHLPENVYHLNGTRAYETWSGGWFDVMAKQLGDLNQFAQDWYLGEALN